MSMQFYWNISGLEHQVYFYNLLTSLTLINNTFLIKYC